jgi:hypothetical protein
VSDHLAPSSPLFDEEGACLSAEDWLGKRFSVGDKVMYCIGAGRGQQMAIGTVKFIRATPQSRELELDPENFPDAPVEIRRVYDGWRPAENGSWGGTAVYVEKPRAIVIDRWHVIEVQVKTERTSGFWNKPRVKPAWVNAMNITALPAGA